jgi:hypothetical protein
MKKPTRRVVWSALLLAGLTVLGFGPSGRLMAQKPEAAHTIWTGRSGGFMIHWTTLDISAQSQQNAQVLFSVLPLAKRGFEAFLTAMKDPGAVAEGADCSYERHFRVLSVVGSLISVEDAYYAFCQDWAHPAVETRWTAIDLAKPGEVTYAGADGVAPIEVDPTKPGKVVRLTDFFAEDEIRTALLADSLIKGVLQNLGTPASPQTLRDLPQLLRNQSLEAGECVFRLPEDFLTRFVFHHVEKDHVAVRLGLPPNAEACRTQHAQLGIPLPIPAALKTPLALAASGQAGFLMQDQKKLADNQRATVAFGTGAFARD